MEMKCDRCKQPFDGDKGPDFTAGYYEVGPTGKAWGQYANPGEIIACDACMWADPRYIAAHGKRA
jgi:hypothetical protein